MDLSNTLSNASWQTWVIVGFVVVFIIFYTGRRFNKTWAINPFTMLRVTIPANPLAAVTVNWRKVGVALLALAGLIVLWLNWTKLWIWLTSLSWSGSTATSNTGTTAATPWWNLSNTDFASYVPPLGMQALLAAIAALLVILLLVAIFKGLRAVFSGWGLLWAFLLFALLAVTFFFAGPFMWVAAQEMSDWTARTWNQKYPTLVRVALTIALVLVALTFLVKIFDKKDWKEMPIALGTLLFGVVVVWFVIWNFDWERRGYPAYATAYTTTTPTSPCTGNGERAAVGPDWVTVNPGFKCHIIFEVVGAKMLLGEPGNYVEASPGSNIGNVLKSRGIRVISVKATTGSGYLNYKLYPQGCMERGWDCS